MAGNRTQQKGPAAYAREAFSEWGEAARYGMRAVTAGRLEGKDDRPPLKERLTPSTTTKGGRLGDAADFVLSKLGTGGKLASKGALGSRLVDRLRENDAQRGSEQPDSEASESDNGNGVVADAPLPIQASIDVAVSLKTAFAMCRNFEEYPEFLDHVERAEVIDETHVDFLAKVRGRSRKLEVEIVDEQPNERLDWQCPNGLEHSGVISFHPLAPRLTRLELTIQSEPRGLVERMTRKVHLTDRAIGEELHRFKAFAELWEDDSADGDPGGDEGVDDLADEEELDVGDEEYEEDVEDEGPEDEALEDDDDLEADEDLEAEEEPEDEEAFEDEEDFEEDEDFEDEELEEGELEPAASER